MNNVEQNKLEEKYMSGFTSLEEESNIFDSSKIENEELATWIQYVNHKRIKAPEGLAQSLWQESPIQKSKRFRTKLFLGLTAASIAILFFILVRHSPNQSADYETKKQLLEEAMAMINNTTEQEKEIFYQDDLVTIYLSYD